MYFIFNSDESFMDENVVQVESIVLAQSRQTENFLCMSHIQPLNDTSSCLISDISCVDSCACRGRLFILRIIDKWTVIRLALAKCQKINLETALKSPLYPFDFQPNRRRRENFKNLNLFTKCRIYFVILILEISQARY